jgi:Bacterial regulatory helix-turn-helix protein, lysR family
MHMREIRYFLALCEEENFVRAARRCGVTQPSISTAIKQLETKFGGPLFDRNRRTTRLSALGALVRPHLADMDRSAAAAKHEAAQFLATNSVNSVPTLEPKEKSMRKVIYSVAISAAVLLFVSIVNVRSQQVPASAQVKSADIVDVRAIEATIDISALPRQDILSEADE